MSGFTGIDLSKLPAPQVVEPLSYEDILAELRADLVARAPELAAVIALESEPAVKILQVAAYRELLLRQRVNDAARAVMLPHAVGADLDNLAALLGVARQLIDPGDPEALPPIPPTWESDARLRRRAQLALEGFSTAGPAGAYVFHALSASVEVADASVTSPAPGEVLVTVLASAGDGTASPELVATVAAALSHEDVRPLTDHVTVQGAQILPYAIAATLTIQPGPDPEMVRAAAEAAATAFAAVQHRLGHDVTLSGLYAALHQPGVHRVALSSPAADIVAAGHQATWCLGVTVTTGGIDV